MRIIIIYSKSVSNFRNHFSKKYRSLVIKIDSLLIETLELFFTASKLNKEQKFPLLNQASNKVDLVKFFLQFAWDLKVLDNKKYILIAKEVAEIGKMLGNWLKTVRKQTLPK